MKLIKVILAGILYIVSIYIAVLKELFGKHKKHQEPEYNGTMDSYNYKDSVDYAYLDDTQPIKFQNRE